jgi:hypothetical protein
LDSIILVKISVSKNSPGEFHALMTDLVMTFLLRESHSLKLLKAFSFVIESVTKIKMSFLKDLIFDYYRFHLQSSISIITHQGLRDPSVEFYAYPKYVSSSFFFKGKLLFMLLSVISQSQLSPSSFSSRFSSASQSALTRVIALGGHLHGFGYKFYEWMPSALNLGYLFSKGNLGWYTPCKVPQPDFPILNCLLDYN